MRKKGALGKCKGAKSSAQEIKSLKKNLMLNGIKEWTRAHPAKLPIWEKKLKKSCSIEGNHQQKADKNVFELGSQFPAPASSRT